MSDNQLVIESGIAVPAKMSALRKQLANAAFAMKAGDSVWFKSNSRALAMAKEIKALGSAVVKEPNEKDGVAGFRVWKQTPSDKGQPQTKETAQ